MDEGEEIQPEPQLPIDGDWEGDSASSLATRVSLHERRLRALEDLVFTARGALFGPEANVVAARGDAKLANENAAAAGRLLAARVRSELLEVERAQSQQRVELHRLLAALTSGVNLDDAPIRRYVPVRVFLSNHKSGADEELTQALLSFLGLSGFTTADEFQAQSGSWFKQWIARTKRVASQPEVKEYLQKAERAIELAASQRIQAEVDRNQAEAAAVLLKALDSTTDAACQIGSLLLIKVTGEDNHARVVTRTLTAREMIELERNPNLLRAPSALLAEFSKLNGGTAPLPPSSDHLPPPLNTSPTA